MFTKLFSSITTSSIWNEDSNTRIVWITMLAMANKNGYVSASVGGLAHEARVEREECEKALNVLSSPDLDSRSKEFEGRRIEMVDGGFQLLNYEKYRAMRSEEERKEYMKTYMAEYRRTKNVNKSVNNVSECKPPLAAVSPSRGRGEAEAEADKEDILSRNILNYLNEKTGKKFQPVNGSLKFIASRLREGATEDQCRAIIDSKCVSWLKDSKMKDYLRPQTLFNAEKFAAYVGELGSEQPKQNMKDEWESFGKKI